MKELVFHPCPGAAPHGAWMNIVLAEGDGYDKSVAVTLTQADLHNIILLAKAAEAEFKGKGETPLIWADLAERMDAEWQKSLTDDAEENGDGT